MVLDELIESPAFWVVGGIGTILVLLGWIISRGMSELTIPWWNYLVLIAAMWGVGIYFALNN